MRSSALGAWLMLACFPVWGEGDPFAPPQARCQLHQADLWRYGGMVKKGESVRVLLQTPDKKWLRVSPGATLPTGWQLTGVEAGKVTLKSGEGCRPSVLVWTLKDAHHDKEIPSFIITRSDNRLRGAREPGRLTGGG
nr:MULTISPECIES: HofP DNA utilization family protein [unclassified Cronobacter]